MRVRGVNSNDDQKPKNRKERLSFIYLFFGDLFPTLRLLLLHQHHHCYLTLTVLEP
jgi:hypothetical protein